MTINAESLAERAVAQLLSQKLAGFPRVVAVINGKGGVFKSSIVGSLATMAAKLGQRVCIVDLDKQGNQIRELGLAHLTDDGQQQLDTVPYGLPLTPVPTGRDNLDIIFGGEAIAALDEKIKDLKDVSSDWMHALASSLEAIEEDYDLILIDCPPGFPNLQMMALVAARYALIPTRSDEGSIDGLSAVAALFDEAREQNPDLELLGVVRTGITVAAKLLREQVKTQVQRILGDSAPVFEAVIRYAEMPAVMVRRAGRVPHELDPGGEREEVTKAIELARLARLREQKKQEKLAKKGGKRKADPREQAEIVLTPSLVGLAEDYTKLYDEFIEAIRKAEAEVMEA